MLEKNRLHELYAALQQGLAGKLQELRHANRNAEAKGDASERVWIELLRDHLPERYEVNKGFVVDSNGCESHFIDVIIYDRHYTPCIFNRDGNLYLPAESVYAVLEAKQELNKAHVEYAATKAESVRCLRRTSASIQYAAGKYEPKEPGPILAGILTYECSWKDPFGDSLQQALGGVRTESRIDLGIAVGQGAFEVNYGVLGTEIVAYSGEFGLAAFLIRLLARLQNLGTVPAIDYNEYSKMLK